MWNRDLYYAGLGVLLPATAVAVVAVLAHKYPKRISEKWATIVATVLAALAMVVFGRYGFPAITTVWARVAQMVPFVALAFCSVLLFRFWLTNRSAHRFLAGVLGRHYEEHKAALAKKAPLAFVASIDDRLTKSLGETRGELRHLRELVQEIMTKETAPTVKQVTTLNDMFRLGPKI